MKLWAGRFTEVPHGFLEEFLASIDFDVALASYDILGSLAHATMLAQVDLITKEELEKIKIGLKKINSKIQNNEVQFSLKDEDIHLNIESLLFHEIGEAAGKLHTGRSRNDQVALDLHLYLRQQLLNISAWLVEIENCLIKKAELYADAIMPGYTHLHHAQPVLFAHHLLAYAYNFKRDNERLQDLWKRVNILPLGACALAGSDLPLDRVHVAQLLAFDAIYENSMDAVSNRDLVIEFLSNVSMIMLHLSRLAEEIILWSTEEFDFIELDDAVCTGSSIMPQKKNPDVAELIRGKTGRVYGSLIAILTTLKALPMAYNKDLQEDKESLFDAVKTTTNCLQAMTHLLSGMKIKKENMFRAANDAFSAATLLANYLTKKHVPFREAHHVVGKIVQHGLEDKKTLSEISLDEYKKFHPFFSNDIYDLFNLEKIASLYQTQGSTSFDSVNTQLKSIKKYLESAMSWIDAKQQQLEASYEKL